MSKITLIFVGGNSEVDKVIDNVSHGDKSHVAIGILGSTLEALGMKDEHDLYPGVWLHDPLKYQNNPDAIFKEVEIPDIQAAETEARKLIGTLYGYDCCIKGGVYDQTGLEIFGNLLTANCSKTVTLVLRAGGFNILPSVNADCITPNDLYRALEG